MKKMNILFWIMTLKASIVLAEPQPISENLLLMRDPFKMPEIEITKITPKSDLEKFSVDSYKLLGVLTGPEKLRAMVSAPDGKTYFVAEKMKIGLKNGIVSKITLNSIQVREKDKNLLGQDEYTNSEIRMDIPSSLRIGIDSGNKNPTLLNSQPKAQGVQQGG